MVEIIIQQIEHEVTESSGALVSWLVLYILSFLGVLCCLKSLDFQKMENVNAIMLSQTINEILCHRYMK